MTYFYGPPRHPVFCRPLLPPRLQAWTAISHLTFRAYRCLYVKQPVYPSFLPVISRWFEDTYWSVETSLKRTHVLSAQWLNASRTFAMSETAKQHIARQLIILSTVTVNEKINWCISSVVTLLYCFVMDSSYGAVKCRLIWRFRGQALLLRVLHVVACDNVRDCVFLKDDLNRVKKGFNSYELNFSLPTNSQNKLTELN